MTLGSSLSEQHLPFLGCNFLLVRRFVVVSVLIPSLKLFVLLFLEPLVPRLSSGSGAGVSGLA